jgi:tryptophan-rich sensory protein
MFNLDRKWFRAKDYGWGWTPSSLEGWIMTALWAVALVADFIWINGSSHSASDILINFIPHAVVLTGLYLLVVILTGETPHWRWGGPTVTPGRVWKETGMLVGFIVLAHIAGIIGAVATNTAIPDWYMALEKPGYTPPNWVFGPVWAILYTMIGAASYIIFSKRKNVEVRFTMLIYFIHLGFNALWSYIFFGLRNPEVAAWVLAILIIMIVTLVIRFWQHSKFAAALLIPYLAWCCFALYLNTSISLLN